MIVLGMGVPGKAMETVGEEEKMTLKIPPRRYYVPLFMYPLSMGAPFIKMVPHIARTEKILGGVEVRLWPLKEVREQVQEDLGK